MWLRQRTREDGRLELVNSRLVNRKTDGVHLHNNRTSQSTQSGCLWGRGLPCKTGMSQAQSAKVAALFASTCLLVVSLARVLTRPSKIHRGK